MAYGKGITPAHAGKTSVIVVPYQAQEDHPRACGENGAEKEKNKMAKGSPPRMRGKLSLNFSTLQIDRITPAHAGKTYRSMDIKDRL